jgi:hypothetical protein
MFGDSVGVGMQGLAHRCFHPVAALGRARHGCAGTRHLLGPSGAGRPAPSCAGGARDPWTARQVRPAGDPSTLLCLEEIQVRFGPRLAVDELVSKGGRVVGDPGRGEISTCQAGAAGVAQVAPRCFALLPHYRVEAHDGLVGAEGCAPRRLQRLQGVLGWLRRRRRRHGARGQGARPGPDETPRGRAGP